MIVTREMKNRQIIGEKVILTPYLAEHVDKYHRWMTDERLLYLTGSEPLSIDEEYAMQRKWFTDEDKCTFIILDRATFERTNCSITSMIGDTNVFVSSSNCDDNDDQSIGELEIMIAEIDFRGKGLGKEAAQLMLRFSIDVLKLEHFEVKIKIDNINSQVMFRKFGFIQCAYSEIFNEITFKLIVNTNDDAIKQLMVNTDHIGYKLF